jgi:hypothetical protein
VHALTSVQKSKSSYTVYRTRNMFPMDSRYHITLPCAYRIYLRVCVHAEPRHHTLAVSCSRCLSVALPRL